MQNEQDAETFGVVEVNRPKGGAAPNESPKLAGSSATHKLLHSRGSVVVVNGKSNELWLGILNVDIYLTTYLSPPNQKRGSKHYGLRRKTDEVSNNDMHSYSLFTLQDDNEEGGLIFDTDGVGQHASLDQILPDFRVTDYAVKNCI